MKQTVVVTALFGLALTGCPANDQDPARDPSAPAQAAPGRGKVDPDRAAVVARVGGEAITVGMLSDEINKQNTYVRMRYSSLEQRKKLLQQMIRFDVLVQEARRRGLERDPEVLRQVKRVMVNRLMTKLRSELVKMEDITDKEVQDYYNKNIELYRQPNMVRVSQIVTATRAEAEKVLALAKKKPGDTRHFAELVRLYSKDSATKTKQGDLDFFSEDTERVPRPIREAAFAIREMWDLSPVIKTDDGYVVLMKTGYRDKVVRPLELEKSRIRNRLFNQRRLKAMEDYVERLEQKAKVELHEQNLSRVKLKVTRSQPPPHAPHGH
jgi:parvulin-like peptidyl-prolyl isomerase